MAISNRIDILYVEIILVKVAYLQDSNRPLCCPRSALSLVTALAITWHLRVFLSDSFSSHLACPSNFSISSHLLYIRLQSHVFKAHLFKGLVFFSSYYPTLRPNSRTAYGLQKHSWTIPSWSQIRKDNEFSISWHRRNERGHSSNSQYIPHPEL